MPEGPKMAHKRRSSEGTSTESMPATKKRQTRQLDHKLSDAHKASLTKNEETIEVGARNDHVFLQQTLKSLQEYLDSQRARLTCKICFRMLYEPYTTSCGHTYCYTCLCSWFKDQPRKTCPDCRTSLRQSPAPAYLIREQVHELVGKEEFLPEGETVSQHERWLKEEGNVVESDRLNKDRNAGGLFRGMFRDSGPQAPIYDHEDHVFRCPICHHEVEMEGRPICSNCDWVDDSDVGGDSEADDLAPGTFSTISSADEDAELDGEFDLHDHDTERDFMEYAHDTQYIGWGDDQSASEEDTSLSGFIDDGDSEVGANDSDYDSVSSRSRQVRFDRRQTHILPDSDDGDVSTGSLDLTQPRRQREDTPDSSRPPLLRRGRRFSTASSSSEERVEDGRGGFDDYYQDGASSRREPENDALLPLSPSVSPRSSYNSEPVYLGPTDRGVDRRTNVQSNRSSTTQRGRKLPRSRADERPSSTVPSLGRRQSRIISLPQRNGNLIAIESDSEHVPQARRGTRRQVTIESDESGTG